MSLFETEDKSAGKYAASDAEISPCGAYRYVLRRTWDSSRPATLWVMVNPSTADSTEDDPTIRKCVGFARAWGHGGIVVVNLFAARTPDVRAILSLADPVGPGNDAAIIAQARTCDLVVAGWGSKTGRVGRLVAGRAAKVREVFRAAGRSVHCLARGGDGQPCHPLFRKYDRRPELLWG